MARGFQGITLKYFCVPLKIPSFFFIWPMLSWTKHTELFASPSVTRCSCQGHSSFGAALHCQNVSGVVRQSRQDDCPLLLGCPDAAPPPSLSALHNEPRDTAAVFTGGATKLIMDKRSDVKEVDAVLNSDATDQQNFCILQAKKSS